MLHRQAQGEKAGGARDPWTALNDAIEAMSDRFEVHIGYTRSDAAYEEALQRLLEVALRGGKAVGNGSALSIVVDAPNWESGTLCLSVDPGRAKQVGVFG